MRGVIVVLALVCWAGLGCGSSTGPSLGGEASSDAVETVDGLVKREVDLPGMLFLRDDHGIGGYDAFLIPQSSISYRRGSRRLPEPIEQAFLASLEQSLFDAAETYEIPVTRAPGPCVLQVAMGLVHVDLERSSSARQIGSMTLVMEFRDTESDEPLLRYARMTEVANQVGAGDPGDQLQSSFDAMVAEMEISGALRAAGLGAQEPRPGCDGLLAQRGEQALQSVSGR